MPIAPEEFDFRIDSGVQLKFSYPQVGAYEQEKDIQVVKQAGSFKFADAPCLMPPAVERILEADSDAARCWRGFYGLRMQAALDGNLDVPAFFPGHTIPAAGSVSCCSGVRYRGLLLADQFRDLLSFDGGQPQLNLDGGLLSKVSIRTRAVRQKHFWPWHYVPQPQLQFVESEAEIIADGNSGVIEHLQDTAKCLQEDGVSAEVLLQTIHRAWTDTTLPVYSGLSLQLADCVVRQLPALLRSGRSVDAEQFLNVLFELEGFAGYSSLVSKVNPIASGIFSGNWIDVGLLPLQAVRGTEFCISNRLFSELRNLSTRGFAPIVVNEFGNVSDGNHRLTASWIWNILSRCLEFDWDLENLDFQLQVREVVLSMKLSEVSKHEALHHLAVFLQKDEYRHRLRQEICPLIERAGRFEHVPVVFLPEYFSTTVVKHAYDSGTATMRVAPAVYETMQKNPLAVLPPRASYHFTDCALLPWFSLVGSPVLQRQAR